MSSICVFQLELASNDQQLSKANEKNVKLIKVSHNITF